MAPKKLKTSPESEPRRGVFNYDTNMLYDLLILHGIKRDICVIFRRSNINGEDFQKWTKKCTDQKSLKTYLKTYFEANDRFIEDAEARHLLAILNKYKNNPIPFSYKMIQDCVYGAIAIHPLLIKIIDTPQFQRLRNLKQLGCLNYVYPCASHSRFEHSIGTSHLAGLFVNHLNREQPSLGINNSDELCVRIAGLCHDMGHGPFSHMFEQVLEKLGAADWKHEIASIEMFDRMIKENKDLKSDFESFGLFDEDLMFIKDMIYNESLKKSKKTEDYEKNLKNLASLKARGIEKSFLFEIVSNNRNGIDVDKFDYIGRDCMLMGLGFNNKFDHNRFIYKTRVIKEENSLNQICVRDKEVNNIYELYHIREHLTRRAYKHETASSINMMVIDALYKANDYFKFSEIIQNRDYARYEELNDNIISLIQYLPDKSLKESKEIIDRLTIRKLYKYIGSTCISSVSNTEDLEKEFYQYLKEQNHSNKVDDNVLVDVVKFNYGRNKENPIGNVNFYKKGKQNKLFPITKEQVGHMYLQVFEDVYFRVYTKNSDESFMNYVSQAFSKWCEIKGFPKPLHAD